MKTLHLIGAIYGALLATWLVLLFLRPDLIAKAVDRLTGPAGFLIRLLTLLVLFQGLARVGQARGIPEAASTETMSPPKAKNIETGASGSSLSGPVLASYLKTQFEAQGREPIAGSDLLQAAVVLSRLTPTGELSPEQARQGALMLAGAEWGHDFADFPTKALELYNAYAPDRFPIMARARVLARGLASTDSAVRLSSARELLELGPDALAALPELIQAAADADRAVRRPAVESMGSLRPVPPSAVPALVGALADLDPRVSRAAAAALQSCGEPCAEPVGGALQHERTSVRLAACRILAALGPEARSAAEAVAALLTAKEPQLRRAAADVLAAMAHGGAAAAPALVKALDDEDPRVGQSACRALAAMGSARALSDPAPAVKALARLILSDDDALSEAAATAASRIGEPALAALAEAARAKSPTLSDRAARALADMGPIAVKELSGLLGSEDPLVRARAASALGRIGPQAAAAAPDLQRAASDPRAEVRQAATVALGLVGPEAAGAVLDLIKDLDNDDPYGLKKTIDALGRIGRPAVRPLLDAARAASRGVITARLAEALAAVGEDAADDLTRALGEADARDPAATALRLMGAPAAPALARALVDPDPAVRFRAAKILSEGGAASGALPALTEALHDLDLGVRAHAAKALARAGETGVLALADALTEDDPLLHSLVLDALAQPDVNLQPALPALRKFSSPDSDLSATADRLVKQTDSGTKKKNRREHQ